MAIAHSLSISALSHSCGFKPACPFTVAHAGSLRHTCATSELVPRPEGARQPANHDWVIGWGHAPVVPPVHATIKY